MENNKHRFVVVSYKLYCNVNGEEKLFEETDDMKPMELYTGCDLSLPAFEQEEYHNKEPHDKYGLLHCVRVVGYYQAEGREEEG